MGVPPLWIRVYEGGEIMALPLLPSAIAAAKLAARSPAVRAGAKRGFKKAVSGVKAAKKATPSTVGRLQEQLQKLSFPRQPAKPTRWDALRQDLTGWGRQKSSWRPGKTGPNWRERKWASNRRTRSGPPGTKGGK